MILLLVLFSVLSNHANFGGAVNTCSYLKLDTVFILDASESIEKKDFTLAKEFVITIMTYIKSANNINRISFMIFGDKAEIIFDLEKYTDLKDMVEDVRKTSNANGLTAIGKALNETFVRLYPTMRRDFHKLVILFTDGTNNMFPSPYVYADRLKDVGVNILTVGIGAEVNDKELQTLASPNMALKISSFSTLLENLGQVIHSVCPIPDPVPNVPCKMEVQDLVIILDASESISDIEYEKGKAFTAKLIQNFKVDRDKTHAAMLSFSDGLRHDFNFTLHDETEILSIIKGLAKFGTATGIGMALRETFLKIQPTRRKDVPFNVLLITDGVNNMYPRPLGEAVKLKNEGANIITLGIGNQINLNELKAISSDDKVLTVDSYNELIKDMKTVLKTITCG